MFSNQNIKLTDVVEVEGALRALLRSQYPEVNVGPGSTLNDLVIRPMGYLAAALKSESDQVKERLYISQLTTSEESSSQALLEDLASNFLVSIEDVPPQRGIVTFVFTSSVDRLIPASIILTRGDTGITVKLFDSSEDVALTTTDYISVGTGEEVRYHYPILMELVGTGFDVSIIEGTFETSTVIMGLDKIENKIPFIGVTPTEYTRSSLSSRMRYAQTLRGFHSRNSIQATLLNEGIPNLVKVLGVGGGDPEMSRDILPSTLSSSKFHSLGMVNVVINSKLELINTSLEPQTMETPSRPIVAIASLYREGSPIGIISDFETSRYFCTYDAVTDSTSISAATIELNAALDPGYVSIEVTDSEEKLINGSSSLGRYTITAAPSESGVTQGQFWVDNNIPIIQALIDSDQYNTLGSDTKAMAFTMVQVIIPNLEITAADNVTSGEISVSAIKRTVVDLINTWDREYCLPINEIVNTISLLFGGLATNVRLSEGVKYVVNLPDGRIIGYNSTNKISVEAVTSQIIPSSMTFEELLSLQVSDRVIKYYCNPNDILVEVSNV